MYFFGSTVGVYGSGSTVRGLRFGVCGSGARAGGAGGLRREIGPDRGARQARQCRAAPAGSRRSVPPPAVQCRGGRQAPGAEIRDIGSNPKNPYYLTFFLEIPPFVPYIGSRQRPECARSASGSTPQAPFPSGPGPCSPRPPRPGRRLILAQGSLCEIPRRHSDRSTPSRRHFDRSTPPSRHFDRSEASGEIRPATGAGRTPEAAASTERPPGFSAPPRPGGLGLRSK